MSDLFSPLVERAIELSAEWHDQTYRKSRWRRPAFDPPPEVALNVPVMAHLAAVALTLQRAGWDDETVAAGFLHDVIEDENRWGGRMSYETLAEAVSPAVAERVAGVSEPKRAEDGRPLPWQVRKDAYIAHLETAEVEVAAISLADKLHNLYTMNRTLEAGTDIFRPGAGRQALSAGPERQRWYFRAVLNATARHADPRLEAIRAALRTELDRFDRLTAAGG